jgi:hypothetical protein
MSFILFVTVCRKASWEVWMQAPPIICSCKDNHIIPCGQYPLPQRPVLCSLRDKTKLTNLLQCTVYHRRYTVNPKQWNVCSDYIRYLFLQASRKRKKKGRKTEERESRRREDRREWRRQGEKIEKKKRNEGTEAERTYIALTPPCILVIPLEWDICHSRQ